LSPGEPLALDYFSGGVPAGAVFWDVLGDIRQISAQFAKSEREIQRLQEISFVGSMSYFEAFCKDHFASLINIEPSLVERLREAGQDVTVDASAIALYGSSVVSRLGFLVAEKYDFGTAKKINALYSALLKVSPFSTDEAQAYSRLLGDRNLIVHHGGTYTLSYVMTNKGFCKADRTNHAFLNSCVVGHDDVATAVDLLERISKKLVRATYAALVKSVESAGLSYDGERAKALEFLQYWIDEPRTTT
jgi:hypothetical protein